MSEVFERDVHNAIKKLVENNFVVSFGRLELMKRTIVANEIAYLLSNDEKSTAYSTADEAIREMSHIIDAEDSVTKSEFIDVWNRDYGPLFKGVDFQELRKYYENKG